MRAWAPVGVRALLATGMVASCATAVDSQGIGTTGGADASVDRAASDSWVAPVDVDPGEATGGDEGSPADGAAADDGTVSGKSCQGLPDGTPCGPAPDICHEPPLCSGGTCAAPPPKPNGTVCGKAPDACHDAPVCANGSCPAPTAKANGTVCGSAPDACHAAPTCSGGSCASPTAKSDGTNWSSGDATAICCSGKEVHATSDSDCGACGIRCNASNGESCSALGGHYFCRGCVASSACWSKCCSLSFSPASCAASDCNGNCDSQYCPAGTHCVVGAPNSSDYCAY